MTKREWKVGERCWVVLDAKHVAGKVARFDEHCGSYRIDFADNLWAWRCSTAIYKTRLDAQIDDAKAVVEARKSRHGWALQDAAEIAKRVKRRALDLEAAEKRLAALRAKGWRK